MFGLKTDMIGQELGLDSTVPHFVVPFFVIDSHFNYSVDITI